VDVLFDDAFRQAECTPAACNEAAIETPGLRMLQ
jgi:hypothetical protein